MTHVMGLLEPEYQDVLEAKSFCDLRAALVHFAVRLGFTFVSGLKVIDTPQAGPTFISLDNVPEAYRPYYTDPAFGRRNHVMQHCKVRGLPIAWDQTSYVSAGEGDAWETQARFGYRCGISLPLHLPRGRHFVLGVVRDQDLPRDRRETTNIVAALHLFAAHAQESAWRLQAIESSPAEASPQLTSRELECLRWTMEGKTAWEVSRILDIAENTAIRHLQNATHKLGCASKHHAVILALRHKLIW